MGSTSQRAHDRTTLQTLQFSQEPSISRWGRRLLRIELFTSAVGSTLQSTYDRIPLQPLWYSQEPSYSRRGRGMLQIPLIYICLTGGINLLRAKYNPTCKTP